MDGWLLDLPDKDIVMAISAVYDSKVRMDLLISRPDLMPICFNPSTQRMAEHLITCGFDRMLAMLSWDDRYK